MARRYVRVQSTKVDDEKTERVLRDLREAVKQLVEVQRNLEARIEALE